MQITDIKIRKFFDEGPMKAVISALPAIIFALCIQKHLVRGLSFGAVKG